MGTYKGVPPKDEGERINRMPPAFDPTEVEDRGDLLGPDLPAGYKWCEMTVEWWEIFRVSPQAQLCVSEMDWQYMLDTANLHNDIWKPREPLRDENGSLVRNGDGDLIWPDGKPLAPTAKANLMCELRRRTESVGGDPVSRRKLRMTIRPRPAVTAEARVQDADWAPAEPPPTRELPDYRKMLGAE